jgi:predicted GNAT family acetyltransferase
MSSARIAAPEEGLHRLYPRHRRELVQFLGRQVEHNVYLLGQVARGALGREDIAGPCFGFWERSALAGACCMGSNLVISTPSAPEALAAFAELWRAEAYPVRVAIGQDGLLDHFMRLYRREPERIAVERSGQHLMRLGRGKEAPIPDSSGLRKAEMADLESVVRADLAMVQEELGFDPFTTDLEAYREGWKRRVREGRVSVVGPLGGPLWFKVEQSAVSQDAVQISGVYTDPARRRQGIAAAAVAALCREILAEVPRVMLHVHHQNLAAVRLYERLGFEHVGLVRSVWFVPE